MKINESKLKQIINEEMMMLDDKYHDHEIDEEGGMAKSQLYSIAKYAIMLHDALEDEDQLESWVQSKITKAVDYISTVKHYLEYEMGLGNQESGGCGANPHDMSGEKVHIYEEEET